MNKYSVSIEWAMSAYITVEAQSLIEAVKIAQKQIDSVDFRLPTDGDYVDGSIIVRPEFIIEV